MTHAVSLLAVILAGAVVAGIVQGISGFAFGMVALSIWIWRVDPHEAVVLAVFGGLCGQLLSALRMPRETSMHALLPFLCGGLLGVPLGTWLLPHLSGSTFRLILGLVLLVGCPLMLFSRRAAYFSRGGAAADGTAGFAGGVIGGLSGFTGIAPAIWCTVRGYDKARQRALLQNFNLVTLAATFVLLVWKGSVTRAMYVHLAIVAFALILPSMIGARIYTRLSDAAFRRVVLVLLTVAGGAIVASAANL
jgi:uncharacterized membrane protein YfcA